MEANALAVRILEIWGDTPAQAQDFMAHLLYANRGFTSNSVHDFCAELRDLPRRYPPLTPANRASVERSAMIETALATVLAFALLAVLIYFSVAGVFFAWLFILAVLAHGCKAAKALWTLARSWDAARGQRGSSSKG